MRRLNSLVWGLPVDAVTWARIRAAAPPPAPEKPKVDYDALRALGGQVTVLPRKAATDAV